MWLLWRVCLLAILRHGGAFFLFCLQRVCVVDGAGGDKRFPGPSRAERVKGDGRGSARGRRESRGWGTRPSGNAAQRNLGEPSKKRKWQRKQGQIEPSSGISNEPTQLGHSINTPFLMSVCARATRTPALRRARLRRPPQLAPAAGARPPPWTWMLPFNWERAVLPPGSGSSAGLRQVNSGQARAPPRPRSLCVVSE